MYKLDLDLDFLKQQLVNATANLHATKARRTELENEVDKLTDEISSWRRAVEAIKADIAGHKKG